MARPLEKLQDLSEKAVAAVSAKEGIRPGFEPLAAQKLNEFLGTILDLEVKVQISGEIAREDKSDLLIKFTALARTLVNPDDFQKIFDSVSPWLEELIPVATSVEIGTATETVKRSEVITDQIDYFSRFIAKAREGDPAFLINIFPNVGPTNAPDIAERLSNLSPEHTREALRQLYFFICLRFDNLTANTKIMSSGGGAVFGDVKFPTEGTFSLENFIEVSGDPAHNVSRTLSSVLERFPPPFKEVLRSNVLQYIDGKQAASGVAAAIYAEYKAKGRIEIKDYIPFVKGMNPLNQFTLRHLLGNEVAYDRYKTDPETGINMAQDFVHGDLIRYAQSLLDTLHLEGAVPDPNQPNQRISERVPEQIFEIVKRKVEKAYKDFLGRELNPVEIQFVDSCVRWAHTARRMSGSEFLYDKNAIASEVTQMVRSREYHPKKNIEFDVATASAGEAVSGSKYFSKEVWMILRRAAVPWEYVDFLTVRLPNDALEVVGPEAYFRQLGQRYPKDKNKMTEVINAYALLTPDMRKGGAESPSNNPNELDFNKIKEHFVAVRVKQQKFRSLNLPDSEAEYILLPKSHVVGHKNSDGIEGKYVGLTLTINHLNHLGVKYFDDNNDEEHLKKYYAGLSQDLQAELRRFILFESLNDTPGIFYNQYFGNSASFLYDLARTDKVEGFDIRKVRLVIARYPEKSTAEALFGPQPIQQVRELFARQPLAPMLLQTFRAGFNAERHINPRIHSMEENMSIESGVDEALRDKDSPLYVLFNTGINYIVSNAIAMNPKVVVNPITGGQSKRTAVGGDISPKIDKINGKRIDARSMFALRLMFGDRLELAEDNKPLHPEYPWSPSTFSPKKMFKFIDAWENGAGAVGLESVDLGDKEADGVNQLGLKIEILFAAMDLYLSKYKLKPLPDTARLADFKSYTVQTVAGALYEPLTPLDIMKLRVLISRLIYNVIIATVPRDSAGGMTYVRQFLENNHYTEKEIHDRLNIIMRNYGILDSFESAIVALKFEHTEYEKLPTGHDIQKKAEEVQKK